MNHNNILKDITMQSYGVCVCIYRFYEEKPDRSFF